LRDHATAPPKMSDTENGTSRVDPCASGPTSTVPGAHQAGGPASAGARNDAAGQTGAASTNSRRPDVAGPALAGLSTGTAPPRLAEKENALRCAGAHGKASVPELQGVP
jgi:hypothetical protein